jgi:hypothetical protein
MGIVALIAEFENDIRPDRQMDGKSPKLRSVALSLDERRNSPEKESGK